MKFNKDRPPEVFFDTNVWRGLNDEGTKALRCIQETRGFRYRYSVTNFAELVSHLEDQPSPKCKDPFGKFRSCFRRIVEVCDQEILPSPEIEFLAEAGLEHYIDPGWIPDVDQIAAKVIIETSAPRTLALATAGPVPEITCRSPANSDISAFGVPSM